MDFERGLNFCIAQIRAALRDSAESPSYIETLPKQGDRFIAVVEAISEPRTVAGPTDFAENSPLNSRPASLWAGRGIAGLVVVSLIVVALIGWARASSGVPTIVVVPFYNETGAPEGAPSRTRSAMRRSPAWPLRIGSTCLR